MKQAQVTFSAMVVISIVLVGMIVWPFKTGLFLAAVAAGVLHPLHRRLTARLGGRAQLSSALITIGVLIAIIGPLSYIATVALTEMREGVEFVQGAMKNGGPRGLVEELPEKLQPTAEKIVQQLPEDAEGLGVSSSAIATRVGGVFRATGSALLQTVVLLIALFFLLIDGPRLVRWLEAVSPLKEGQLQELLTDFRRTNVTVLRSSVVTAAVQATAALIGYLIASIPHALFFTIVTFILALIPVVGAAGVSLALAGYLAMAGHTGYALFLAIWGIAVVGVVDNVVKPLLIRGGMDVHGAIVFFALIGGIAAFGPIGIVAGPIIVSFLLALVRIYARDYAKLPPDDRTERIVLLPRDVHRLNARHAARRAAAPPPWRPAARFRPGQPRPPRGPRPAG